MGNLAKNTQHQDLEIKKAAIMTLGNICDKLASSGINIPATDIESILTGICIGMAKDQQNLDIKKIAIKALHDSLRFIKNVMERQEIRDFVMDLLVNCGMSTDPDVTLLGFQCLMDAGKILYDLMNIQYISVIKDITLSKMNTNEEPDLVVAAIEFWHIIAEEEKERTEQAARDVNIGITPTRINHNFIIQNLNFLLKGLTDNL